MYLVSDTLYTEAEVETLVPLLTAATPTLNPSTGVFSSSFVYNNPGASQYLYLVWNYRGPIIPVCASLASFDYESSIAESYSQVFEYTDCSNNAQTFTAPIGLTTTGPVTYNLDPTICMIEGSAYPIDLPVGVTISNYVYFDCLEPLPDYYMQSLHYNVTEGLACAVSGSNQINVYTDTYTFSGASLLFNDVHGLSYATSGWYTDGSISRYWTGTNFTTEITC